MTHDAGRRPGAPPVPERLRESRVPRSGSLASLRTEIDRIDDEILRLLARRGELALEVGHRKSGQGRRVYAPGREKRVLRRMVERNPGPLGATAISDVYRAIMSGCRDLQKTLRVAFLGPEGTFSEQATAGQFGAAAEMLPQLSIEEVFTAVERGQADYGVVPVENSTQGVVSQTLDSFVDSPLTICAEILLRIEHCLLARSARLRRPRRIVSHAQSLAQCRGWLARNYPGVPQAAVASNAAAADIVARETGTAAIAGRAAARRYGLRVLAEGIQDQANNCTRFLVLGREGAGAPTGDDKTSVLFSVRHQAGALFRVLEPFAEYRINMSTIESRPLKGRAWEYVFFLDLSGHMEEKALAAAVRAARRRSLFLKVLGSYPAWRWPEEDG